MFSSSLFAYARARLERELSNALETVSAALLLCEETFTVANEPHNPVGAEMRREALAELSEQLNFASKIEKRVQSLLRIVSAHVEVVVEVSPHRRPLLLHDDVIRQAYSFIADEEEEEEEENGKKGKEEEEEEGEGDNQFSFEFIDMDNEELPEEEDIEEEDASYNGEEEDEEEDEDSGDEIIQVTSPPKRQREEEEDSFINPTESEVSEYQGSEYDEHFNGQRPKEKKRQPKKIVRFSPDQKEKEDDGGNAEDLFPHDLDPTEIKALYSTNDLREWQELKTELVNEGEILFQHIIKRSLWFQQRFLLEPIRDNFGREGNNAACLQLYEDLVVEAYSQDNPPKVEHHSCIRVAPKDRRCCLCNCPRNCPWSLWLRGESFPIARTCGNLARQIVNFFDVLRTCVDDAQLDLATALWHLDRAMTAVQEAHAAKGEY